MKQTDLLGALADVKPDLLIDAAPMMEEKPKRTRRPRLLPLIAASLLISLLGAVMLPLLVKTPSPLPSITTEEDALPPPSGLVLQAQDVSALFPAIDGVATSNYSLIYLPGGKTPTLFPLPEDGAQYAVYTAKDEKPTANQYELDRFAQKILPGLLSAIGMKESSFAQTTDVDYNGQIRIEYQLGAVGQSGTQISFSQTDVHQVFYQTKDGAVKLNGKTLQIDQRQSETEILSSLEWAKKALFSAFDVTFTDAKVTFSYDDTYEHGAKMVYVTYYSEADGIFGGDSLQLVFNNYRNSQIPSSYAPHRNSDDILKDCTIKYRRARTDSPDRYEQVGKGGILSLTKAEELLKKGHVFGNHACRLCMEAQSGVDFEDYDAVSFDYIVTEHGAIPFYTFYKKIGVGENGNIAWAVTNVCAFAVEGMEEYLSGNTRYHGDEVG